MKNIKYIVFTLAVTFISVACSNSVNETFGVDNPDQYSRIYSAQALDDSIKNMHQFSMTTDTTLNVFANFGGLGYPNNDIGVKFRVAPELVQEYNENHSTDYPMLFDESYGIEDLNVVIKKGELRSTPLKLKIDASKLDGIGVFVLPLHIESTNSNIAINEKLRTAFVLVKPFYESNPFKQYARDTWKIAGYSSQEPGEGGGRGGAATDALDNKNNTYWCTAWRSVKPGPPHWIAINMHKKEKLHGLVIRGRAEDNNVENVRSEGNPRLLNIQVSNDGVEWKEIGGFSLINELENTLYFDHMQDVQYFKITVTASHGDSYGTNIAEINAF